MKQNRIVFTIILPVFNRQRFLEECLESLFLQTYCDFEIIAIDDGSTDLSLQILETYKNKHSNLSIITQNNQGVSQARNAGLKLLKEKNLDGGGDIFVF